MTNWLIGFQYIMLGLERDTEKGFHFLLGLTQGTLDQVESFMTLNVSTDFLNERLKGRTLIIYGDDNDWRISPRLDFEYRDNIGYSF